MFCKINTELYCVYSNRKHLLQYGRERKRHSCAGCPLTSQAGTRKCSVVSCRSECFRSCWWFLLGPGSNGELRGSRSARTRAPVLGAAPAGADGSERAGQRRVRTGEVDPGRRQCEFPRNGGEL